MPKRYQDTPAALRIDGALRASKLNARQVAEAVGIAPNLLSMIRTGETALPARRCGAIARALGLDPLELLVDCLKSYADNRSWEIVSLTVGMRGA
jgi:transcriptional regulator with XRE-family HTH domain